ncbi:MAG TPA: ATP-binding protein [Vicinamibacterales bacterium]|nr:ATP-binding protein [Vicinamibacterales bacterium]
MRETFQKHKPALAIAGVIALVVLGLDVMLPLGSGVASLYAIPLILISYFGPRQLPLYGAWLATLLIVLHPLVVPFSQLSLPVLLNRAVALAVVWAIASVIIRLRRTALELTAAARDVIDVKYAIDQSAIVATTNTRGTITYVNDKFCEISKYDREELLGQDHRILNSRYHSKEFIRDLWTTISSGRVWRGDIRNRAKDGSLYWVATTIVPFLDARGKPYQYMAIRYEITEQKRQEEQLREQAALTRLGEMAAVVAHEVKNPIAGIRGALQVIMSRMPAEQRDRSIIGDIIARLDALNGIVQDLLLYARPRAPKREPVDVRLLIENTADLLRKDPALAQTTLNITGRPEAVLGDPEQLRIVFQNLLMNAAQAMAGTGAIDVTLRHDQQGCRIAIRDHGPGMPAEVRAKAFEAFFTTKHRGTGLGLPIARRVVEAHGGAIDILQADGGGTTVSIQLPLSAAAV